MLDPHLQSFFDFWGAAWAKLPPTASWDEQRQHHEAIADAMLDPTLRSVKTTTHSVPHHTGDVHVRVFHGDPSRLDAPCLVYFHGGGWVRGSSTTNWYVAAEIARANKQTVISVDYALAPEHVFPRAVYECEAATKWAFDNADMLGINPAAIVVGGDSAGGNLAAAVALMLRGTEYRLLAQWLIYPVTDFDTGHPSYTQMAEVPGLLRTRMDLYSALYCPPGPDRESPLAAPLLAETLVGLPPAFVGVAENDILRDCGLAYAQRLAESGVPVTLDRGEGLIHGYLLATAYSAAARQKQAVMIAWLDATNRSASK
ncbi:MAG TPA: alpha/beta hydrolase [Devosia sp.]|nr:alpha/beta hydrolase [Devosia sp.]